MELSAIFCTATPVADAEQLEALVGGLVAQMRVLRHAAEGYFDSPGQTPSA